MRPVPVAVLLGFLLASAGCVGHPQAGALEARAAAEAPAAAGDPAPPAGELLRNPSCELLRDGLPEGFRHGSDSPVRAEARVEVVGEAHGGGRALAVTRLNEAGEYYVYAPFAPIPAGAAARHFAFSAWLRGEAQAPLDIKLQCANAAWTSGWWHLVEVHRTWRQHRLLIRLEPGRDLTHLRVAFRQGLVGDRLLIDDLSLREIDAAEYQRLEEEQRQSERIRWSAAALPPRSGRGRNLLANGAFETGIGDWGLSYTMSSRPQAERLAWCGQGAHAGTGCLRYQAGRRWYDAGMRLQASPVAVEPGRTYTLSAWLRSDRPGAEAGLEVRYHAARPAAIERRFTLAEGWTRQALTFTVGECPGGIAVVGITNASAWLRKDDFSGRSLWVDDVLLEEGGLSEGAAPGVGLAAVAGGAHALVEAGDAVRLLARVRADAAAQEGPWTLEWSFEDLAGERHGASSCALVPGAAVDHPIAWEPGRLGAFCAHLALRRGEEVLARCRCPFAVLPRMPAGQAAQAGLFGLNTATAAPFREIARRMGAGSLRLHDDSYFRWAMLRQDRDDPYAYEADKEAVLAAMKADGFHVLANLELGSLWASSAPPEVKEWARLRHPPVPDDWRGFVRDQLAHFGPLVDAWEVWNEPYLQDWWQGTPAQYVALLRDTCQEMRRADPSRTVVGICGQGDPRGWNAECLALGAAASMDVLSYHEYVSARGAPVSAQRRAIAEQRDRLRRAAGRELPVWNSECGVGEGHDSWYRPRPGLPRRSPGLLVQAYATALAGGVGRLYWYALGEDWGPAQAGGFAMLEYDGSPKPVVPAFAACARLLAGKRFVRDLDAVPGLVCPLFAGEGGAVAVAWSAGAQPVRLTVSARSAAVADLMGNPLPAADGRISAAAGHDPLYLTGASPEAIADALAAAR